jgi:hypothetical protein
MEKTSRIDAAHFGTFGGTIGAAAGAHSPRRGTGPYCTSVKTFADTSALVRQRHRVCQSDQLPSDPNQDNLLAYAEGTRKAHVELDVLALLVVFRTAFTLRV